MDIENVLTKVTVAAARAKRNAEHSTRVKSI